MSKAAHPMRHAIALSVALLLAACSQSQVENSEKSAADPGHASGEHGSSSSAGLPAGREAAGEARARVKGKATNQSCIDCHGADGNAPIDPTYPKLGGQYGDYLAHALQAYRAGDRQHMLMTPQAKDLSDQDIADLAAYFGSRPSQLRICTGSNDRPGGCGIRFGGCGPWSALMQASTDLPAEHGLGSTAPAGMPR